jgi:N-methylhydantoinase A
VLVAVHERVRLAADATVIGPAIVEEMGATTVIPPGWVGAVGAWGELVLQRRSV